MPRRLVLLPLTRSTSRLSSFRGGVERTRRRLIPRGRVDEQLQREWAVVDPEEEEEGVQRGSSRLLRILVRAR